MGKKILTPIMGHPDMSGRKAGNLIFFNLIVLLNLYTLASSHKMCKSIKQNLKNMKTEKKMPRTGELLAMLQEAIDVNGHHLTNAFITSRTQVGHDTYSGLKKGFE